MSRPRKSAAAIGFFLLLGVSAGQAQTGTVEQYREEVKSLLNQPPVQAAIAYVDRDRPEILREWSSITEINAPSGLEKQRAAYIESLLRSYHLRDIHYDSAGNLIASRKGTGGGPVVVKLVQTSLYRPWRTHSVAHSTLLGHAAFGASNCANL